MKKLGTAYIMVLSLIVGGQALADGAGIEGTLIKIEDQYYSVKDDKGEVHRMLYDEKTRKRGGEIKQGIQVELYVHDDRVSMIEVIK